MVCPIPTRHWRGCYTNPNQHEQCGIDAQPHSEHAHNESDEGTYRCHSGVLYIWSGRCLLRDGPQKHSWRHLDPQCPIIDVLPPACTLAHHIYICRIKRHDLHEKKLGVSF